MSTGFSSTSARSNPAEEQRIHALRESRSPEGRHRAAVAATLERMERELASPYQPVAARYSDSYFLSLAAREVDAFLGRGTDELTFDTQNPGEDHPPS